MPGSEYYDDELWSQEELEFQRAQERELEERVRRQVKKRAEHMTIYYHKSDIIELLVDVVLDLKRGNF